jgi:hypothetical protein
MPWCWSPSGEFHNLDLAELAALMSSPILIDGRNFFMPDTAIAAGFDYSESAAARGRAPRSAEISPAAAGPAST